MPAEVSWINQMLQRLSSDPDAFTNLYNEMKKPMYAVAYRITGNREDAEDSVQDAFLNLLRGGRGSYARNGRAYLFQIVHNEALRRLRKRSGEIVCGDPAEFTAGAERIFGADSVAGDARDAEFAGSDIESALCALSDEERRIVSLRVEAELGYAEIAKVTGKSLPTVFRRYRAAIRKMQQFFGRNGENPSGGKE